MTAYDRWGKRQLLRSGMDQHPLPAQFLQDGQPEKSPEMLADPIPGHVAQFQFRELQVRLHEPEVET